MKTFFKVYSIVITILLICFVVYALAVMRRAPELKPGGPAHEIVYVIQKTDLIGRSEYFGWSVTYLVPGTRRQTHTGFTSDIRDAFQYHDFQQACEVALLYGAQAVRFQS